MFSSIPFDRRQAKISPSYIMAAAKRPWTGFIGKHGLKSIISGMIGAEASGWFRKGIKTLSDLKALKKRFFGFVAGGWSESLASCRNCWRLAISTQRLSAAPFVILQLSALTLVIAFSDIALWLPRNYLN